MTPIQKLTIFRRTGPALLQGALEEALAAHTFEPTGPAQDLSAGFVPPRPEGGALVENIGGQLIACLAIETRSVPSAQVQKVADEKAAAIEQETGRMPGRKEMRSIREDVLLQLLPHAFPRRREVPIWLRAGTDQLIIGTTNSAQLDVTITRLVRAVDGLAFSMLQTTAAPAAAMARWLFDGEVADCPALTLGRDCALKATDESKAVARFASHNLACDVVREHIKQGKLPERLGLVYENRVSFRLGQGMQLDAVKLLDSVMQRTEDADAFDADVAITTGELAKVIDSLVDALGGQIEVGGPAK